MKHKNTSQQILEAVQRINERKAPPKKTGEEVLLSEIQKRQMQLKPSIWKN